VLIGALLLAAMAWFVSARLQLSSDITHFLAAGDDARLAKLSRQLAESDLSKTTVLVIDSRDGDTAAAIAAADQLAAALAEHEEVDWVRAGWSEDQSQAIHELYFPRCRISCGCRPRRSSRSSRPKTHCCGIQRRSSDSRPPAQDRWRCSMVTS
jgi:predicted exporter